jgi:phage recombination protein Bet
MTDALAVKEPQGLTKDQIDLIKRTVARGATADELSLFLHIANKTGLDPFARQIHAIKRWSAADGRETMAVQTGIDGYRLVAERTNKYCPGREPTFKYDNSGKLIEATAYVLKLTADGQWHEVAASARFSEYAGRKKDGSLTSFWQDKPHIMLAKVAEALALRRAFPMDLSGLYTFEEMEQAENGTEPKPAAPPRKTLDSVVEEATKPIAPPVEPVAESKPVEAVVMPPEDKYPTEAAALVFTDGVRPDCPGCRGAMRFVKGGMSKPSEKNPQGRRFSSFWACESKCGKRGYDCGQWVDEYRKRLSMFDEAGQQEPEQEMPL